MDPNTRPGPEDGQAAFLNAARALDIPPLSESERGHAADPDIRVVFNRAERRANMNRLRAMRVRAARRRNIAASKRGLPTPAEPITVAIRRAGALTIDERLDGHQFLPPRPQRRRWKKVAGAMVPRG